MLRAIDAVCPRPFAKVIMVEPETWSSMLFSYGHIVGLLIIALLANVFFIARYCCHGSKRSSYVPIRGETELSRSQRSTGSTA